jgi:hypothetical protein
LKTSRLVRPLYHRFPIMSEALSAPDRLRTELAHKLGFPHYPSDTTAKPYLNYLTNRRVSRITHEEHIKLLLRVIASFDAGILGQHTASTISSIQGLIDALSTDKEYCGTYQPDLEDIVLYTIGLWTMLLSSFILLPMAGSVRRVKLAYGLRMRGKLPNRHPYEEDVAGLVVGSGLLPAPAQYPSFDEMLPVPDDSFLDLDSLESLAISATRLNMYTLKVFGAVDILWTHNISRHLLLSNRGGQHILEVFALPCALSASSLRFATTGIGPELAQEIRESYSSLFNAWPEVTRHAKFGAGRFCWCWSCSARQHRNQAFTEYKRFSKYRTSGAKRSQRESEYDPLLIELMNNEPSDWTPDLFPNLWSRIVILEQHLQVAKPWSIWVLFRDRRDTLQFWTFL